MARPFLIYRQCLHDPLLEARLPELERGAQWRCLRPIVRLRAGVATLRITPVSWRVRLRHHYPAVQVAMVYFRLRPTGRPALPGH